VVMFRRLSWWAEMEREVSALKGKSFLNEAKK
jgi:hypothetical protein